MTNRCALPIGTAVPVLISGKVSSPLLSAIHASKSRFSVSRRALAPGAPPQARNRYGVLVVDGDHFNARALARHRAVDRFLSSGRWVLAFNLGRNHFRRAIRKLTGFKGMPRGSAFLFRRTVVGGTPTVQMLNAPHVSPRQAGRLPKKQRRKVERAETKRLVDLIHATVRRGGANLPGEDAPGSGSGAPAELQHVGWTYTETGSVVLESGYWWSGSHAEWPIFHVPTPGLQTASWTMSHGFDVYLDNGQGRPQGNSATVTYNLDGEFSPKQPGQSFSQMFNGFWVGTNKDPGLLLERAWWTAMVGNSVDPDKETEERLIWQASEPQSPNEESEYSSGNEFEIGFTGSKEGAEVEASYKVSSEETHKIPVWGVENEGAGDQLDWLFSSRNGCDVRPGHYNDAQCFAVGAFKDGRRICPRTSRGVRCRSTPPGAGRRRACSRPGTAR